MALNKPHPPPCAYKWHQQPFKQRKNTVVCYQTPIKSSHKVKNSRDM